MNDIRYAGDGFVAGTRNFGDQALYYGQVWGPRILAAIAILLVGWLLARAAKWAIAKVVNRTPLARRANEPGHAARHPGTIGAQIGDAVYWVVLPVAIFMAAQPLGLASATGPFGDMLRGFGRAVPNIVGAVLIFFLGYILANVAKKAVEALAGAIDVERLTSRVGSSSPANPALIGKTLGSIVFALIIIPAAIAALDTLAIDAISRPATAMLNTILTAIPNVVAAGIIVALAYVVGKFAGNLLTQFLSTTGFDRTIGSLGLFAANANINTPSTSDVAVGEEVADRPIGTQLTTPSKAAGSAVFIAIVIFGLMEAFRQLNFAYASRIMAEILALFGQVLFGAIIIAAAVLIAQFVSRAIEASGSQGAKLGATLAKIAIIVLGVAIGLRFMGLADDIINMAFGLVLGALALGMAIALGLGGRQPMERLLDRLLGKAETEMTKRSKVEPSATPAPQPDPLA